MHVCLVFWSPENTPTFEKKSQSISSSLGYNVYEMFILGYYRLSCVIGSLRTGLVCLSCVCVCCGAKEWAQHVCLLCMGIVIVLFAAHFPSTFTSELSRYSTYLRLDFWLSVLLLLYLYTHLGGVVNCFGLNLKEWLISDWCSMIGCNRMWRNENPTVSVVIQLPWRTWHFSLRCLVTSSDRVADTAFSFFEDEGEEKVAQYCVWLLFMLFCRVCHHTSDFLCFLSCVSSNFRLSVFFIHVRHPASDFLFLLLCVSSDFRLFMLFVMCVIRIQTFCVVCHVCDQI